MVFERSMKNKMESYQKQDDEPDLANALDLHEVLTGIKTLIEQEGAVGEKLHAYINTVQEKVEDQIKNGVTDEDKEYIKSLIMKHPYFKNPCDYDIRLITLMKYLKKKGIDVSIKDIDIIVDGIIESIDGVSRIEYGRYRRKKINK